MTTRVCINGKVYFRASVGRYGNIPNPNSSGNVLLIFDVRSERFEHVQIPNQSRDLTLVNYQGRLGCIDYNDGSAKMWIMDNQTEKQEWLTKNIFFMSHPHES
ncbi:putative F-box protein [Cardamine amara subsp. amara]|uniref:F-box protein n=1 Tax=Cardamine amara subsp. amara TaxID=228776 RepID=A0ABD1AB57_CARAN